MFCLSWRAQLLRSEVNGVEVLHSMLFEDLRLISDPDVRVGGFRRSSKGIEAASTVITMSFFALSPNRVDDRNREPFQPAEKLLAGFLRGYAKSDTLPSSLVLMSRTPFRRHHQSDRAAHLGGAALAGVQAAV